MRNGVWSTEDIKIRKKLQMITENIQSEGMAIDPCCHVLKRKLSNTSGEKIYHDNVYCKLFKHNKTNMSNQNVVSNKKTSKIKNGRMSQQNTFEKRMNELQLSPDEINVLKRKSSNMSDPKIYESNVSLKRCIYNKTNISKRNVVLKDTSKIKNVKILQKSPLKKNCQTTSVVGVKYSINTYVRYLNYTLLIIAEMPNYELTGNHTLSLPPLYL